MQKELINQISISSHLKDFFQVICIHQCHNEDMFGFYEYEKPEHIPISPGTLASPSIPNMFTFSKAGLFKPTVFSQISGDLLGGYLKIRFLADECVHKY